MAKPSAQERFSKNSNYLTIDYFEPSKLLEACAAKEGTKAGQGRAANWTFLVLACFRVLLKGLPRPDADRRGPGRFPEEGLCPWPFCQALTELAAGRMSTEATL